MQLETSGRVIAAQGGGVAVLATAEEVLGIRVPPIVPGFRPSAQGIPVVRLRPAHALASDHHHRADGGRHKCGSHEKVAVRYRVRSRPWESVCVDRSRAESWEGRPLVGLVPQPPAPLHGVETRARLGGTPTLLIWSDGAPTDDAHIASHRLWAWLETLGGQRRTSAVMVPAAAKATRPQRAVRVREHRQRIRPQPLRVTQRKRTKRTHPAGIARMPWASR